MSQPRGTPVNEQVKGESELSIDLMTSENPKTSLRSTELVDTEMKTIEVAVGPQDASNTQHSVRIEAVTQVFSDAVEGHTEKKEAVDRMGTDAENKQTVNSAEGQTEMTLDNNDRDEFSSVVSEGGDLREDLTAALQGDFDFKGSFYYAGVAPAAPYPCLNIEGLGLIGLPLSIRDARAIIECSARAPFGHGDRTVVDTRVRDTWEIEPSMVKFDNPAWSQFIQTYVIPAVWKALGVISASNTAKCELYKLLLYEEGSHFLPHQDTQKVDGMFASVIVVLPSPYTGGEVHVSHSASNETVDFASESLLSTSVLAWYTDVTHEVKPLTSGYRLALSYNLIQTNLSISRPTLPDMSVAVSRLHHVLHKWRKSAYEDEMDDDLVAYVLKHEYSEVNLRSGVTTLRGEDAHLVANVQSVAEDLGYLFCLANLSYHVTGTAADYGYSKRGRYYDDWDEEDSPEMAEVFESDLSLDTLVDLEGNLVLGPEKQSLMLSEWNLIPKEPFEGATPDDTDYEGYMGNDAGSLEHWYHRTVLVLVHESNAPGIFYSAAGDSYALRYLEKKASDTPSITDKKMIDHLLNNTIGLSDKAAATVSEYTLKWKDLDMWKMVIKKSRSLISTFGPDNLLRAWSIFGWEGVRQSYEEMLLATTSLCSRIKFLESLSLQAAAEETKDIKAWSEEQVGHAFSTLNSPTTEDIPILISFGRIRGVVFLFKEILPQLVKNASIFDFAIAFVRALHEHKEGIPEKPISPSHFGGIDPSALAASENMAMLIEQLLDTAVAQWDSVVAQPNPTMTYSYYSYNRQPQVPPGQPQKIQRIVEIAEVCLLTHHMEPCNKLFLSVLKVQGSAPENFQKLWAPLVPRIRDLMNTKGVDLCTPPFAGFLQLLVALYLRDVLGGQGCKNLTKVRNIGCGCADCAQIDSFMWSNTKEMETFRLVQVRRLHLEKHLSRARDLVAFVTIKSGSPHGVQVTKLPEIVAAQKWEYRLNQAKAFLLSIGNDDAISRLMGNRYGDVTKALAGVRQFALTVGDVAKNSQGSSTASPSNIITTSSSALPSTSVTTGAKRKKPPTVDLGVVDLTGDDSS